MASLKEGLYMFNVAEGDFSFAVLVMTSTSKNSGGSKEDPPLEQKPKPKAKRPLRRCKCYACGTYPRKWAFCPDCRQHYCRGECFREHPCDHGRGWWV